MCLPTKIPQTNVEPFSQLCEQEWNGVDQFLPMLQFGYQIIICVNVNGFGFGLGLGLGVRYNLI